MSKIAKMVKVFYTGKACSFTTSNFKFTRAKNFVKMTEEEAKEFVGRSDFRIDDLSELSNYGVGEVLSPIGVITPDDLEEDVTDDSESIVEDSNNQDDFIPEICKGCPEWEGCKGSTEDECVTDGRPSDEEEEEKPVVKKKVAKKTTKKVKK